MNDDNRSGLVSSVSKAVKILECFSRSQPELSLAKLSVMLGMPKSTLLNQLRTLEEASLIVRTPDGQSYCLGGKLMELGYNKYSSMSFISSAIPIMESLMNATGKFVYLTSHLDGRVFYIDCVAPAHRNVTYSVSGKTLPMHCTSCGKAMLSRMSDNTVRRIIEKHGLVKVTDNTITDPDRLFEELKQIRRQGYAIDNEEESYGVRCYAMAILNSDGLVAGALSVSGAAISMKNDPLPEQLDALASACNSLSAYADMFPAITQNSISAFL